MKSGTPAAPLEEVVVAAVVVVAEYTKGPMTGVAHLPEGLDRTKIL